MEWHWITVDKPSIHGITRLRCGLYLIIEATPGSFQGCKMGSWMSVTGISIEQAKQECILHWIDNRLLTGSTYKPSNRSAEAGAIDKIWHRHNGHTFIPEKHLEGRAMDADARVAQTEVNPDPSMPQTERS